MGCKSIWAFARRFLDIFMFIFSFVLFSSFPFLTGLHLDDVGGHDEVVRLCLRYPFFSPLFSATFCFVYVKKRNHNCPVILV